MEFLVLGPLEVVDEGRRIPVGSPKQRRLLAALLVHANEVVSVDRLADILWGDEPPADARSTLQTYVSRLRARLEQRRRDDEEPRVLARAPGYVLRVAPEELDATRFERLVADARDRAGAGERARDTAVLDAALRLWRGPAFAEFADEDFARGAAARLEELRLVAAEDRVDRRLASGLDDQVVDELEATVATHPLRERSWGQLMLALYRSGRPAEALRTYQACRRRLGEELGVEPSAILRELDEAILRQDPALDWVGPAASPPASTPTRDDELPTGTVTFLFTDLEESTRLWDEHPDAMGDALSRHDAILRRAVDDHHGRIVKMTGDGGYAVFTAAPDAVAAATQALRALDAEAWGATGPLRVRIAIHTGDAEAHGGDYFGPVLNRASRLMAAAHGGQLVLSQASAELVFPTLEDGLALLDLGEHRLRGLAQPERVYQLTIDGIRAQFPPLRSLDAFPARLPLPGPVFPRVEEEFAGRDAELSQLEAAWERAQAGERQIALIAGEPGIGKTRLAAEQARRAHEQGGIVLYGRCDEDAIVPYQPFVEALRPYLAACPASALRERLRGLEGDLARLFPELLGRIPDLSIPTGSEPETERYRLFEAITGLLNGITAAQPAVLLVDDLHWIDQPTLLLVRHLLRSTADAALLAVACYRDVELPPDHPVADLFADLRREPAVTRVALTGLSEPESGALISSMAGHDVDPPLLAALHRETDGNPFFLEELLRHLLETELLDPDEPGTELSVDLKALDLPESVRDVIARRLRRLPGPVNEVLRVAAVVGPEFDAALIANATDHPTESILDSLDQATGSRLVRQDPDRIGHYAFSHTLVRQTLYSSLGTAQRAQLHRRVGAGLEQSVGRPANFAALAQHFIQAVPLLGAEKAIEYTTKAAREAVADLALEDAVAYFKRALELTEQYTPTDRSGRVELLIDLAEALVPIDEAAGVDAALRAVEAARSYGSPEQFGRAVEAFAAPNSAVVSYPDQVASLLGEAQRALGDEHAPLRARLMALEAFKYTGYQLRGRDGRALADRAVHLAREAGDTPTLMATLFARAVSLESTPRTDERLALGAELVALGRAAGPRSARAVVQGLRVLAGVRLELGDAEALDSAIADLARTGEELHWLPALVYEAQWRATRALLEGRFEEVRVHWNEMRRHARAYRAVISIESTQAYFLAREQGTLAEFVRYLAVADSSVSLYMPAILAVAQLETADESAALRTLDSLTDEEIRRGEAEVAWSSALALLAEVATSVGSRSKAALLHDLLQPFAGRLIAGVIGLACLGAADRYQGMLSTRLERWDDAETHFERALDLEQRIGGRALVPRTRYWQAQFLRARARPSDARAAQAILRGVVKDTQELGMRRLREQAEQLLAR